MPTFRRILVPVDGSSTSNKALATALEMARAADGCVHLVHVVDELAYLTGFEASSQILTLVREGGEHVLADAAAIARSTGVPADTALVDEPGQRRGAAVPAAAAAWKADLVVLGTHGRRGIGRALLGSGAEQIIRLAPAPVLVIRADGE